MSEQEKDDHALVDKWGDAHADLPRHTPDVNRSATDPNRYQEIFSTKPGDYYADTVENVNEGMWLRFKAGGRVCSATVRQVIDALWPE